MKTLTKKLLAPLALVAVLALPAFAQDAPASNPAPAVVVDAATAPVTDAAPTTEAVENVEPSEGKNGAHEPVESITPKVEEPAEPGALSKLTSDLMDVLIPAFVTLIGLLVTWLLNLVRKKTKLDVSDKQIASWAELAKKGANRGAEWARNKAKSLTDGKKVPGPEVLDVAVNWAVDMGRAFKLPEIGREKLVGLIEAHLFEKREDPESPLPLELEEATNEPAA